MMEITDQQIKDALARAHDKVEELREALRILKDVPRTDARYELAQQVVYDIQFEAARLDATIKECRRTFGSSTDALETVARLDVQKETGDDARPVIVKPMSSFERAKIEEQYPTKNEMREWEQEDATQKARELEAFLKGEAKPLTGPEANAICEGRR
jgi:hypothetical protein